METALSVLAPHQKLAIIDAFEYPSTFSYATYKTTPQAIKMLSTGYEGFRVTLLDPTGVVLKQSHEVIWPDTLKKLIKTKEKK